MQKTEDKTRNPSRAEISFTQGTRYYTPKAGPSTRSYYCLIVSARKAPTFIAAEGAHFTPADDALVAPARVEP